MSTTMKNETSIYLTDECFTVLSTHCVGSVSMQPANTENHKNALA